MNSIIRNALAVLLLVLGSAPSLYAQESTSSLPKFFEISNDREWTSQLLEFDEPVDGFRLTVFKTSHSGRTYNNYPYVCLAGIDITDAEGNDIAYVASTNSLALNDGGGLEALQDKNDNTHYHSAYSGNVSISNNDYVYIEIAFTEPQSSFTYRQVRRAEGWDFPMYFSFSPLGVKITPPFNPTNPPEPQENYYYDVTVATSPANVAYTYGAGKYLEGTNRSISYSLRNSNYKFSHWTLNGEHYSTSSSFTYTIASGDANFVAHFVYTPTSPQEPSVSNEYKLTLTSDNDAACTFNRTSITKVEAGSNVTLTAYVNQGYELLGWYKDETLISNSTSFSYQMPAEDVTLVAKFKYNPFNPTEPEGGQDDVDVVARYKLTYMVDGEVYKVVTLKCGSEVIAEPVPTKEGHTFSGWSEVPATMPAEDVVVEGTFTVNIYKVFYYVGQELVHTQEVAYGEVIPVYIYEPVDDDEAFVGWVGEVYETMPAHDVIYVADIETGINDVKGEPTVDASQNGEAKTIYDLQGRKVGALNKGVYIINGKKAFIR